MVTKSVFLSHARNEPDMLFCRVLKDELEKHGMDVWYDETNTKPGYLRKQILQEIASRPIFVVVISHVALARDWVNDECQEGYRLFDMDPEHRQFIPVVITAIDSQVFDTDRWKCLKGVVRIEGDKVEGIKKVLTQSEAINRTLQFLELVPRRAPRPSASSRAQFERGRSELLGDPVHARELLDNFTSSEPDAVDAWYLLAQACDRAALLSKDDSVRQNAWLEGLRAINRALVIAYQGSEEGFLPNHQIHPVQLWYWRGVCLHYLGRYEDALQSFERGLTADPHHSATWMEKARTFADVGRLSEALQSIDTAISMRPYPWYRDIRNSISSRLLPDESHE